MIRCYIDGKLTDCDISDCNSCKKPIIEEEKIIEVDD